MRLVVFADLHLDAAFAWARPETARRRRLALRDALTRVLALADEVEAEAILCAGDLYEHDRFTPDTREFLRATLGSTHRPVLIAPGNHDWYGPRSLYAQVRWPGNVHVFREDRLTRRELTPGLAIWGAAFRGPTRPAGFLEDFQVDGAGTHLALFHGSERGGLPFEGEGKSPHAPFDATEIERAGLAHAFVGHHHTPVDGDRHTYPGNPDPLTFGERGPRGAVIAHIEAGRVARRERRSVAVSSVQDLELDVSGHVSFQQVRDRAAELLAGQPGDARLTLVGELGPEVDLDLDALAATADGPGEVVVRCGRLEPAYDLERLAREPTVRGRFVRDVRDDPELDDDERRRVLLTGLRALAGRRDLEVF